MTSSELNQGIVDEASALDAPWALEAAEVARRLATDVESGLSAEEAASRLDRFGPNRLEESAAVPAWIRPAWIRQGRLVRRERG